MFPLIGIVVVFAAVAGGYLMEKGNLLVLMQPAELVIIGGAAIGTLVISNPPHILRQIMSGLTGIMKPSRFNRAWYLQSLKMLYDLFEQARRSGMPSLEAEIEDPAKGRILSAHAKIVKDHHTRAFICDTFRLLMLGDVDPFALDQLLESDLDVHHHEANEPIHALHTVAESLPGLGIVAAVLGVVITMGSLGGRPEEIGHKVAAALVGTFLGILLCYGLVSPLANLMSKTAESERAYYHVLRSSISAFSKGQTPLLAVEAGRRLTPTHVRPSFQQLEKTCRARAEQAAAA